MRPGVLEQLGPDSVLEREPLERFAAAGQLRAFRHDGFWECMDTYKDAVSSTTCGRRDGRRGSFGSERADGLSGRSVLVTGAYGLLGSWLVEALLDRGARVVALRRDEPAVSPLELLGLPGARRRGPRGYPRRGVVARALNEYEVDSVFHLAAQTFVGTANRDPLSTFETNVRGTWLVLEACRRHGAERVSWPRPTRPTAPRSSSPTARRWRWLPAIPTTSPRPRRT